MISVSREDYAYLARVAEQAERYNDMLDFVKKIIHSTDGRLMVEERSLLSVAYKNLTGTLRGSWRVMCQLEEIEGRRSSQREKMLMRKEKEGIENSLTDVCRDVIDLLDKNLILAARPGDETVFLYKMKGDYYRYIAEFTKGNARTEAANSSLDAYKLAYKLALSTLEATHPTRLGLALNFAVYYRDVQNSPERACHLAKHAFDEAVAILDQMSDATYQDSLLILQLLRDDLILWFKEIQDRDEQSSKVQPARA